MNPVYHDYSDYDDTMTVADEDMGVDFSKIAQSDSMVVQSDGSITEPKKRKRSTAKGGDPSKVVSVKNDKKVNELEDYSEKYKQTTAMLEGSILQLDGGLAEISQDISYIRSSKTLKRKYDYLSMMQNTASGMIGNKIAAIREMNNSITKAIDFDLKRAKDMNLNAQVDDDKVIQDMYKAFVTSSNPGAYAQLGPSTYDMTIPNQNIVGVSLTQQDDNLAYDNYVQNMTPQQHMISLENNPNIQQVVIWDRSTGAKRFEIMNLSTMEILNNVDKHDAMFLEDTTIDPRNNIARNIKLNETYPLIVVGDSQIDEY